MDATAAAGRGVDNRRVGGSDRDRILVRKKGRLLLLNVGDIHWVEAQQDYVTLYGNWEAVKVRGTMKGFEGRLHAFRFARVHRSALVNLDQLQEIKTLSNGQYTIILKSGESITVGKRRKKIFRALIESLHTSVQEVESVNMVALAHALDELPAHREISNAHL